MATGPGNRCRMNRAKARR